jgi:hypothetical protein
MQINTYAEVYWTGYMETAFYLRTLGTDPNTAAELSQAARAKGRERLSQLRDEGFVIECSASTGQNRVQLTCDEGWRNDSTGHSYDDASSTRQADSAAFKNSGATEVEQ